MGILGVPYPIFKYPDLGHPNSVADLGRMVWKRVAREGVSGMLNFAPSNHLIRPPTFTDFDLALDFDNDNDSICHHHAFLSGVDKVREMVAIMI
jgi:hypothetical protein